MKNDGCRLEIFIFNQNRSLLQSRVVPNLDKMEFQVEMLDESRKTIDLRQQAEELLASNLQENAMVYEVYASYCKWDEFHDDRRAYTVLIRRSNSLD